MTIKKQKILKTLFFISIFISLIISGTMSYASAGQIDVNAVTINELKIEDLKPMFESMLGFVQVIGSAISVIIIAVIGVKYMYSSVEEKAEYKKTMIYYVIGAVLIFCTVNIMVILYNVIAE